MLDNFELNQVSRMVRHEMANMLGVAHQSPGSYHYLCDVNGIVCFTHQPHGHVLHDYG